MPIGVYPRTEKHRIALSKAQKRNPVRYWLGKSRSKETKEKISDRLKGRKLTDEHKINIKEGRKKYLKKHPELMKGSKHPCWRGSRAIIKDCIYILRPDHPYANNHGYVKESRLIMEEYLGRFLRPAPKEVVHHINGNPSDNNIKNLDVMTQKQHASIHNRGSKNPVFGKRRKLQVTGKTISKIQSHTRRA